MKILVLGGTGYIGSAVLATLQTAGHDAVAASRTGTVHVDVAQPETLHAAITPDIDAVVYATEVLGDRDADVAALDTALSTLAGTQKPFLYTSGVWVFGNTGEAYVDESSPLNPIPIVGYRSELEQRVLTHPDVRGVVIRPGVVHGNGGGIPAMMAGWAKENGEGRYVASTQHPDPRWAMVHVDDLAQLYLRALEETTARGVYHGIAAEAVPVAQVARSADRVAGGEGTAAPWPEVEAAAVLGELFAEALALDQRVRSSRVEKLGWRATAFNDLADY